MLQGKQVDRLAAKVMRLTEVYEPFLIEEEITPQIFMKENSSVRPIEKGDRWGGEFRCADFEFTVPSVRKDRKYYLCAETGGVEHLISVNGKKVGLTDYVENVMEPMSRVHRYVYLEGLAAGDKVTVQAYYSHTIAGTMPYDGKKTFALDGYYPDRPFNKITLVAMYEKLKDFIVELQFVNGLYRTEDEWEKARIEKLYERLFAVLCFRNERPSGEALDVAIRLIAEYRKSLSSPQTPYVGLIGHSHLDTAWLWTIAETRRKLLRTVSNAVTLLKRYPGYRFFLSTVLYLKWIEEDDKELFGEVVALIREGRIEPNGGAWVECDCNLTGAEPLCRQFVRGIRYLKEKTGYTPDAFWLPDTFGYSAALPQILKSAGIDYFLTTKLSWNDTNVFPYESFRWRGIDGSEVCVHFNSIHTRADCEAVKKRLDDVRDKRESDCVLMAYGYGDGGGGPSDEMVAEAVRTQECCPYAKVEHVSVSGFMKRLSSRRLPLYYGELYLELHRGTYTAAHDIKEYNRRLEQALHDAEETTVFAGERSAKKQTDGLYDVLLLNCFHDILPGTGIAEVTDEAVAQYKQALAQAEEIISGGKGGEYYNTLAFPRRELLPCADGQKYTDAHGETVALAPFEFKAFSYGKRAGSSGRIAVDGGRFTDGRLSVTFENGVMTSLVYGGREYVRGGFNLIVYAENVPYIYDNWDIDADYVLKTKRAVCTDCALICNGEYFTVLRLTYKITDKTGLVTDVILRADSPAIEFDNSLTAGDDHILIRAEFDTTLFAPRYSCETQFGYVERNCQPARAEDYAKFETCAHKWSDLSEKGCGLSLLSDVKYGVSCDGGRMGLTLHKSGTHPDPRGDKGVHRFRYALYPHEGALGIDTVKSGYLFNYRPRLTARKGLRPPFEFESGTVILETVKFGEDGGIVLRLYESVGATSYAVVKPKEAGKKVYICNLLEETAAPAEERLVFSPFEIKTVKIV